MARPRFAYPMYEPLDRYDRDWMIPGLGLHRAARHGHAAARPTTGSSRPTWSGSTTRWGASCSGASTRPTSAAPTSPRSGPASRSWSPTCTSRPGAPATLGEPRRAGARRAAGVPGPRRPDPPLPRRRRARRAPGDGGHATRRRPALRGRHSTRREDAVPRSSCRPNVLLVGFDLTGAPTIETPGETWWFTLSENPTEPRFGLDPSRQGPRPQPRQPDLGRLRRQRTRPVPRRTQPAPALVAFDGNAWGASSAQVAYLLFQLPARAAFLGTKMVDGAHRWLTSQLPAQRAAQSAATRRIAPTPRRRDRRPALAPSGPRLRRCRAAGDDAGVTAAGAADRGARWPSARAAAR